ncbi:MAG: hypothetical protein LBJ12_09700 [Oscillospiraceae bacterium]|jgi:hypothetical protein|nr:hypothetical protein [Oscillospiraceae bacterium]
MPTKIINFKKSLLCSLIIGIAITAVVVFGGGAGSTPPDLSGTYICDSYIFDIGALTSRTDGTVDLTMDDEYTGTYKKVEKNIPLKSQVEKTPFLKF